MAQTYKIDKLVPQYADPIGPLENGRQSVSGSVTDYSPRKAERLPKNHRDFAPTRPLYPEAAQGEGSDPDYGWTQKHPDGAIYVNSRGQQVGGLSQAGQVYDPEGTADPRNQKEIDELWDEAINARLEKLRADKANARMNAERNKRITDRKIAGAVQKTYPEFGYRDEVGQPLETTMVGTKDDAAPKGVNPDALKPKPTTADLAKALEEEVKARYQNKSAQPPATTTSEVSDYSYIPGADPDVQALLPNAAGQATVQGKDFQDVKEGDLQATNPAVGNAAGEATPKQMADAVVDYVLGRNILSTEKPPKGSSGYAVPTAEEREAWGDHYYSDSTAVARLLEEQALNASNPKEAVMYMMMAERIKQYEGWQNEENAYRRGQARAAREMRDRTTAAAQRRDKREYEDQDPSWADTLRKVPIIQNLIGVRRLNPETMEMEWHYPRNAAEGVGALLTSLPMIAHAAVTGDNRMQKEYRGMEQNQMFYPYRMDYADMDDYRRGAMVKPTATLSDNMAIGMADASLGGMKKAQDIRGIENATELIRAKYGDEVANDYLKTQLGIKGDPNKITANKIGQLIATAKYILEDPELINSPDIIGPLKLQLIEAMSSNTADSLSKIEIAKILKDMKSGRTAEADLAAVKKGNETENEQFAPQTQEASETILRNAVQTGVPIDESIIDALPEAAQVELRTIISGYRSLLKTRGPAEAEAYLKAKLADSGLVGSIGFSSNDLIPRSPAELAYQWWLSSFGSSGEAERRYIEGEDIGDTFDEWLASLSGDDAALSARKDTIKKGQEMRKQGRGQTKARLVKMLFDYITGRQGAPATNDWAREQTAKNAAISADIQREIGDANKNTVNTNIY